MIQLIRRMWQANPTWGCIRFRDELAKLGIRVSASTLRKYRPRTRRANQTWKAFLRNHAHEMVAIDFFTVPTATFRVLFVCVIMAHERGRVLHFNITEARTAAWTAHQVINAFPYDTAPEYLLRDRDTIYGSVFVQRVGGIGIKQKLMITRAS